MRCHERGIPKSPFQEALDEVALGDFHRIHSLYLDPKNEYGFRIVIRTKREGDDEGFHHFAIWDHKDNIVVAAIPDPGGDFAAMQLIAHSDSYGQERHEARAKGIRNTDSQPTDMEVLYKQLEQRILGLGSIKPSYRYTGGIGFRSVVPSGENSGRAQFASIYLHKRHVRVCLHIPFAQINDPDKKCEPTNHERTRFKLSCDYDLDYAIRLIQRALDYNLIK